MALEPEKNMEKKYREAKRDLSYCTLLTLSFYGNEIFLKDSFYWFGFIIVHDSIYSVRDDLTLLFKYWTSQVQPVTTTCQRPDLMLHSWRPALETCFLDKLEVIIIVLQLNVSSLNVSGLNFVLLARILSCSFANASAHSSELILDLLPSILLYFLLHRLFLFGTYFLSHSFSSYVSDLKWNYIVILIYYFSECEMTAFFSPYFSGKLTEHSFRKAVSFCKATYHWYLNFYLKAVSQPVYIFLVPVMLFERKFSDTSLISNPLWVRWFTGTLHSTPKNSSVSWWVLSVYLKLHQQNVF